MSAPQFLDQIERLLEKIDFDAFFQEFLGFSIFSAAANNIKTTDNNFQSNYPVPSMQSQVCNVVHHCR